jgi:4-amino-4-deoxy-L-arabinose transferase-like glycosyltransferase
VGQRTAKETHTMGLWAVPSFLGTGLVENVVKKSFIVVLLLLSVVGILAVLYAVPVRAGGAWDSVVYSGTARNLAGGLGFYIAHSLPRVPLTSWPPLYPMILAAPAYFGVDPAVAARWINAIALGCSIFLTGFIAWVYCGRSYALGFLAALLILFCGDMFVLHSQVLSEPPFIAFLLASIAALLSYVESGKTKHVIGTAIFIAAALLTRYAGAVMLIVAFIIIAFAWRDLKQRAISRISLAFAFMIVILPLSIWIIRNVLVKGGIVGERKFVFHPIGLEQLHDLVRTTTLWFAPDAVSKYLRWLALVGLVVVVFGAVVLALRSPRRATEVRFRSTLLLAETCLVFDVVYVIFLSSTVSFLDASTRLGMRHLFPIYPVTVLLLASSLALWHEMLGRQSIMYRILLVICVSIVVSNAVQFSRTVRNIRANGVGFQTAEWRDDQIMRYVRDLPGDTVLYTDNAALIYYATSRSAYFLPRKFDIVTTLANNEFENQMKSVAELGTKRPVVVIFFAVGWLNGPFPLPPELIERWGFHLLFRSPKGACILGTGSRVLTP